MSEGIGSQRRKGRRLERSCFWLFLAAVALGAAGATAETALRLIYREQEANGSYWGRGAFEADERVGYRHAAGFRGSAFRRGEFDTRVEIGAQGLRQSDYEAQVRQPRRILILGDSYVFGLGVNEDAAFATRLQAPLNARGVGVINGGQSGYSPAQEVVFGTALAERVDPDAILLCLFPGNDFEGDYYAGYENVEVVFGTRLRGDRWFKFSLVDYLRTHSYLVQFVEGFRSRRATVNRYLEFQELARARALDVMQPTLEALGKLRDYCADRGIRLGVAVLPTPEGETIFDAPLRAELTATGTPVLDLTGRLEPHHYFGDDWHWNADGHALVAEQLLPFALSLLAR